MSEHDDAMIDAAAIEETARAFRYQIEIGENVLDVDALAHAVPVIDHAFPDAQAPVFHPMEMAPGSVLYSVDGFWFALALPEAIASAPTLRADHVVAAVGAAAAFAQGTDERDFYGDPEASAAIGRAVLFPPDAFARWWRATREDAPAIAARVGCSPELVLERAADLGLAPRRTGT